MSPRSQLSTGTGSRGSGPSMSRLCCRRRAVGCWSWTLRRLMRFGAGCDSDPDVAVRPTVGAGGWRVPRGTRGRCAREGRAVTLLAYRFALDPTPAQDRLLRSHCGAGRVAFNWGVAHVKAGMGQREAETTYGISDEGLTPAVSWSLYSLRKDWNAAKGEVAPWWGQCSKEAFNTGLDGLARALKNWGASRSGKRKGAPVGFPRFKSKHRSRGSVRFTTGATGCA